MKKIFTLLMIVMMLFGIAACSKESEQEKGDELLTELSEPVTITVWNTYTYHQQEAFQEMVDSFNASQDKVTVVYEPQAYQDYDSNLLLAVRNGTGPNITNRYPSSAAAYIEEDLLVNLIGAVVFSTIGFLALKNERSSKVADSLMIRPNEHEED